MSDTLNINRLKSIIEYNLRKFRIGGMDYETDEGTSDPSGMHGLENDDRQFTGWDQAVKDLQLQTERRYAIPESNFNLRDFLAQTIQDILCSAFSNNSFSKSKQKIYNVKPSIGKSIPNNNKPITFIRGNYGLRLSTSGIEISTNGGSTWDDLLSHTHTYVKTNQNHDLGGDNTFTTTNTSDADYS